MTPRTPEKTPNIQKQLRYHVLAREAALRGIEAAEAGKRKEAIAAQIQADKWLKFYYENGGRGPLT